MPFDITTAKPVEENLGFGTRLGLGALRGIQAGGESIVRDVKELAGFKRSEADELSEFAKKERIKSEYAPKTGEDLGTFEEKERIKYRVKGEFAEPSGEGFTDEVLDRATSLRKEFDASKVFKDYQTIERSVDGLERAFMLSTAPDTKSLIASDQALGVMFQKMLDPDSVVRESEYARTPEGAALVNRVKAQIPKLQKGGLALDDEDRAALVEMARALLEGGKKQYNNHYERFENIVNAYQIPPNLVFGGLKKFGVSENEGKQQTGRFQIEEIR